MSTLRQDPFTGRWVILAPGRQDRPNEFPVPASVPPDPATCPFCPGRESETTPEILALGRDPDDRSNGPGWRLRVFPNKYPALRADAQEARPAVGAEDLFRETPGRGAHEVVVYSERHGDDLGSVGPDRLAELLAVLKDREAELARRSGVAYVLPFCNQGPEAGATLFHPHLQIIGTPVVPALVAEKAVRGAEYHRGTGRCLWCDTLAAERRAGIRLVAENEQWTAVAPWASLYPGEVMLAPRRHRAGLVELDAAEIAGWGSLLDDVVRRLQAVHGNPSLNLILHGAILAPVAPGGYDAPETFHLHCQVTPRLVRLAGFETGTGFAINSLAPETAAGRLRGED